VRFPGDSFSRLAPREEGGGSGLNFIAAPLMSTWAREMSVMSGENWKRWTLIAAGVLLVLAIGGFLVAILVLGSPSHRGESRSAPHSTTN